MLLVIEIIIWLLVIVCCVLLTMAIRKMYSTLVVPLQVILNRDMGGNRQWIPLKLNASGVMPIIFAQAIMFMAVAGLSKSDTSQSIVGAFSNMFGFGII
jgi:preprotein translocase subunit SecY